MQLSFGVGRLWLDVGNVFDLTVGKAKGDCWDGRAGTVPCSGYAALDSVPAAVNEPWGAEMAETSPGGEVTVQP